MKTEALYDERKYAYNSKPEIDEFWNDCIEQKDKKHSSNKNKQNSNMQKNRNQYYNCYQQNQYNPQSPIPNPQIKF